MAVNKVIYGGNTLIDISGDTVTAETLAQGVTAHNAKGEPITGTMTADADTVDGLHLVVATTEATTDDKSVIRFIY